MLIAVVSDTHRMTKYINLAKRLIKDADILIHLGDNIDDAELLENTFKGKVYAVAGNCDYSTKYPKESVIEVNGKKIFFTHGDLYGVKSSMNNIYYRGRELNADIVLFGHTHQQLVEKEDDMILMNPGSISLPKFKGRYIGFINIDNNGEVDAYLKEIRE
ncbi:MAG: metallophosphoesterase [Clostridium beijerinckii]|jgi:putative phosphoesterase|uniref:metallophosphoesterase n=1 Tax=Clostridium beijerinckii TaxID=1520 RepID=UPI00242FAF0B|nr:metallophosphoesterase [Clostridium beijerinckii]MCI1478957.1 metallophosphoesterase [Clostridium beijerinckii]MCI1580462.1 metallophosphoesterase [Clostridium beijerinckii]MCI1584936.1 metallophosphoesterase [Clostridium beijerinckii]MCI1623731.1 metallophosphoesterase [Clostridium beijerinckii]MDG5855594.1 metallophosphoesterase [Clostridium beijerinckii]